MCLANPVHGGKVNVAMLWVIFLPITSVSSKILVATMLPLFLVRYLLLILLLLLLLLLWMYLFFFRPKPSTNLWVKMKPNFLSLLASSWMCSLSLRIPLILTIGGKVGTTVLLDISQAPMSNV